MRQLSESGKGMNAAAVGVIFALNTCNSSAAAKAIFPVRIGRTQHVSCNEKRPSKAGQVGLRRTLINKVSPDDLCATLRRK